MSSISQIRQEVPEQSSPAAYSLSLQEETLDIIQILAKLELENIKAAWKTVQEASSKKKQLSNQKWIDIKLNWKRTLDNLQGSKEALAEQIETTMQALDRLDNPEKLQTTLTQIELACELKFYIEKDLKKYKMKIY